MRRERTRPTRQDTADRLIEGAREAFIAQGFGSASVENICSAAGLTRGAFYSSFRSKDELFFALYDRMTAEVRDTFAAAFDVLTINPEATMEQFAAELIGHYELGREWYVLNAEFTLYAIRDPRVAAGLATRRRALRAIIADQIDRALQQAGRRSAIDRDMIARLLVAIADGSLGQSLIEPDVLNRTALLRCFLSPLLLAISRPDGERPVP